VTGLDYGRVRCPRCGTWYGLDESHVCASSSIQIDSNAFDPAALPDPDRPHPAGLTWVEPLVPRPIVITDSPDTRPALDIQADRFWSGARHGLAVGRARIRLDDAALRYALSADLGRAPAEVSALAQAATAWDTAITDYAKELAS